MTIHPQVIEKEGKKEFVILPYEEFLALRAKLEDYEDLKDLREAKAAEGDAASTPLSDLRGGSLGE